MKATILGASGFIGRNLAEFLRAQGFEVSAPGRDEQGCFRGSLGHLFYCIGVTSDFRERPFDTVRAHVCFLAEVLERCEFESLLYLSSVRVYAGKHRTREEEPLAVTPGDPSSLYNLSKLMGESLCLASPRRAVRVARLSNVIGFDPGSSTFLAEVISQALSGRVRLRTDLTSCKDYVAVVDVCRMLAAIALRGSERLYNVASGVNVSHAALLEHLKIRSECRVEVEEDAPVIRFPEIDIGRIRSEFGFEPAPFGEVLSELLERHFRAHVS